MKTRVLFLFLVYSFNLEGIGYAAAPVKKVVAGPDSTVYGIAYENGIPTRALIAANNLKPPYTLSNGQVLIIPSPNEHIAGEGETLKSIADEYGVNVDVLAQENEGRSIKSGEHLAIPSRDTESLTEALRPPSQDIATSSLAPLPSVKSAPSPGTSAGTASPKLVHSLPSELAAEIAREKGGPNEANKESSSTAPQSMLMGNLAQGNAGAPTAATTSLREEEVSEKPKKVEKKKEKPSENKEKIKKTEKNKDATKEKKEKEAAQPQFIWPVEGKVISTFKPGKSDGIKIKVAEGTSVKAAAAGKVLYAGNELEGFGHLLLLKHTGGWVTAYAHNSSLLVKKGDSVKQGQVIAKSGKTGGAKEPQLHFEIRKGKQPVDPLAQLSP